MKGLAVVAACAVMTASSLAVSWTARASASGGDDSFAVTDFRARVKTMPTANVRSIADGVAEMMTDEGWLPDPAWGPWYLFTDPLGDNPDSGRGSLEYAPGRVGIDSQGRFVVAGLRYDQTRGTACDQNTGWKRRVGAQNIVISRYLANGASDPSFGIDGTTVVPQSTHTVDLTDLVILEDGIYVSASTDNIACGVPKPSTPPSIVVKVDDDGGLATNFGNEGVWVAPGNTFEEVALAHLGGGMVGGFYAGWFVSFGVNGPRLTNLSDSVCIPPSWEDIGSVAGCPVGRFESHGTDVGGLLTYAPVGPENPGEISGIIHPSSQVLRVFFARVEGGAVVPNTFAGSGGVVAEDLSWLLDGKQLVSESGWVDWDREGRLIVVAPASEPFPVATMDPIYGQIAVGLPHARGLVTARFSRTESGGFALDSTYGQQGATYVPLAFAGADRFWPSAMGLDAEDRPVLVAQYINSGTNVEGQFTLRMTAEGVLDPTYAQGGIVWLPEAAPYMYGTAALDVVGNQYFATAWDAFRARKKSPAPFQLGRLTSRGVVQVHSGSRWVRAAKQARMRAAVQLMRRLPSEARRGDAITVSVRVTANESGDPFAEATTPVVGATVKVNLVGAPGKPTLYTLARKRTNDRGVARLTFRVRQSGYYGVVASAGDRIVDATTPLTRITVRAR